VLGVIAGASFIAAMVGYFLEIPNTIEIMEQMLKLIAASTILLGVRKVTPRFGKKENEDNENEGSNYRNGEDPYLENPKKE
jgi:zinc transporter ZupT